MKKLIVILACSTLCVLAFSSIVFAQEVAGPHGPAAFMAYINMTEVPVTAPQPDDDFLVAINSSDDGYDNNFPTNKLGLGTINATTSWSDVPVEIAETTARDNFLSGITFGFARGLAQGFTRTAAGLVDIATFPFPPYEEAMMEPEYKVSQPQKGYKVALLRW